MLVTVRDIGVFNIKQVEVEQNNLVRLRTMDSEDITLAVVLRTRAMDNHILAFQERTRQFKIRELFSFKSKKYGYHIESSLQGVLAELAEANKVDVELFAGEILSVPTELVNTLIEEIAVLSAKGEYSVIHMSDLLEIVNETIVQYGVVLTLARVDGV